MRNTQLANLSLAVLLAAGIGVGITTGAVADELAPQAGECTNTVEIRQTNWELSGENVPCDTKHTTYTLRSYPWNAQSAGNISFSQASQLQAKKESGVALAALESSQLEAFDKATDEAWVRCTKAVSAYIGARHKTFAQMSSLTADISGPTQAQWDNGARWIRCSVVDYWSIKSDRLNPLPENIKNIMTGEYGDSFRTCYGYYSDGRLHYLPCAEARNTSDSFWQYASTSPYANAWPGLAKANKRAKALCASYAKVLLRKTWKVTPGESYYNSETEKYESAQTLPAEAGPGQPGYTLSCSVNAKAIKSLR